MKIGFTVLLTDYGGGEIPRYSEIKSMARQAEAGGFDSIWLYDHLLYRFRGQPTLGIWECWSMLAAIAEATERVEIGTLVACNSFRNPAILAKMAETVDEISSGRLILGIGAGWNQAEYDAFGIPFEHIRSRFEEAAQIIRPLLRDRELSFRGRYYQVEECEITPRGPRSEGVPLMIGAFGPRMMRIAARHADVWNTAYTGGAETFEKPLANFRQACREVGRDLASVAVSALANVAFPDLGDPPTRIDDDSLSDELVTDAYIAGTTEELADEMRAYESMGAAHLMFHCHPYTDAALERLAEAVAQYRASASA